MSFKAQEEDFVLWSNILVAFLVSTRISLCRGLKRNSMKRLTIEDMCITAEEKGLICLSQNYVNTQRPLLWQCKICLHIWPAKPNNIRSGKGCPKCAGNLPYTLDDTRAIAKERGGECLSTTYSNCKTDLDWMCSEGHKWSACLDNVINGETWCEECSRKKAADNLRGDLATIQKICLDRGGECISTEYINSQTKMKFRCAYGHEFEKVPNKIKQEWCPQCQGFIGEEICRWVLEQIFKTKFPSRRPVWFKKHLSCYQLDGFSEELSIAFEHHGRYHYEIDRCYSKTEECLEKRKKADLEKLEICENHGVKVIVVPEIFTMTPLNNLKDVIFDQCKLKGIEIPEYAIDLELDFNQAYKLPSSQDKLQQLSKIAENRGGRCLLEIYLGFEVPLSFECAKGHIFPSIPQNIINNHWCGKCAGNAAYDRSCKEICRITWGKMFVFRL